MICRSARDPGKPCTNGTADGRRVPRPSGGRPRSRPAHVSGDEAYSSRRNRSYLRRRRIKYTIPEPRDQRANRRRRGSAGGRPAGFDQEHYRTVTAARTNDRPAGPGQCPGRNRSLGPRRTMATPRANCCSTAAVASRHSVRSSYAGDARASDRATSCRTSASRLSSSGMAIARALDAAGCASAGACNALLPRGHAGPERTGRRLTSAGRPAHALAGASVRRRVGASVRRRVSASGRP